MFSQGSRYLDQLGGSQLLLTPWSRVLHEQLTVPQLVKEFPAVCAIWSFITIFTSACHLSLILSHSNPVQSPHPTFFKIHFNIILPSTPWSCKWYIFVRFSHQNPLCISIFKLLCSLKQFITYLMLWFYPACWFWDMTLYLFFLTIYF